MKVFYKLISLWVSILLSMYGPLPAEVSAPAVEVVTAKTAFSYASVVADLGLSELADTFTETKVRSLVGDVTSDSAFALLVGIGLLEPSDYDTELLAYDAEALVDRVRADPIFLKSLSIGAPVSADDSDYTVLQGLLFEALAEDITTGYNVTVSANWPNYAPERMLIYGHNDLQHLRQLLFLLRTEGMGPKFRFLPKRSAFKIREEWGVADADTPKLPDGTPVALITEYELFLEFEEAEDVLVFQDLVTRYAKRDSETETGLIYKSWWQPFYRSLVPTGEMVETREIWVSVGGLKANILSIPSEAPGKLVKLRELSSVWSIEEIPLWVNPSFYRYLLGDYK